MNKVDVSTSDFSGALPSLGFFGGTWADCLVLEFPEKVSSLEIRLSGENEEFLNLRGVVVRGVNERSFRDAGYRIEQSSQRFASQPRTQDPLALSGIHTLKELSPYWKTTWLVPQAVATIRVFNRADNLGKRAPEACVLPSGTSLMRRTCYMIRVPQSSRKR